MLHSCYEKSISRQIKKQIVQNVHRIDDIVVSGWEGEKWTYVVKQKGLQFIAASSISFTLIKILSKSGKC